MEPSTCIYENDIYLKRIADTSVIVCDETINATDSASTNLTNTFPTNMKKSISRNVTSTMSANSDNKNVRFKMDYYILHTFSLVIILLFIIAIICYCYTKYRSKRKCIGVLTM